MKLMARGQFKIKVHPNSHLWKLVRIHVYCVYNLSLYVRGKACGRMNNVNFSLIPEPAHFYSILYNMHVCVLQCCWRYMCAIVVNVQICCIVGLQWIRDYVEVFVPVH